MIIVFIISYYRQSLIMPKCKFNFIIGIYIVYRVLFCLGSQALFEGLEIHIPWISGTAIATEIQAGLWSGLCRAWFL